MTLKKAFLFVYIAITGLLITLGALSMYQVTQTNKHLRSNIPQAVNMLNESSRLGVIAQLIRYDDEVLTQSARNYAFTGNTIWKERYDKYAPLLDSRIKEALEKGDSSDKALFSSVDDANKKLVDLETQVFALVDLGDKTQAQVILDGSEYLEQKAIYKDAVDKYLLKKGGSVDQAVLNSTKIVDEATGEAIKFARFQGWTLVLFLVLIITIWTAFYFVILVKKISGIYTLKDSVERVTKGDLEQRVKIETNDELGNLANSYNKMIDQLRESKLNIEQKVAERTQQLEKLNKYMTGREMKMIELKKKIVTLEKPNNKKIAASGEK